MSNMAYSCLGAHTHICVWNETSQVLNELVVHINIYIQLLYVNPCAMILPKGSEIFLKEEKQPDQAGQSRVHRVLKPVEKAEGPEGSFFKSYFHLEKSPYKIHHHCVSCLTFKEQQRKLVRFTAGWGGKGVPNC